jgi:hypothetical protein
MTAPLSPSQLKAAREIDTEVVRLLKLDGDEALLMGMLPLMGKFKLLMDDAKPGQLDALCEQFPAFGHFAKLLEAMASSIADGNFNDILGR